jgi:UDP-N-acetylmuramate-alanine ligase
VERLRHLLWNGHHGEVLELLGCLTAVAGDIGLLNGPAFEPKVARLVELCEALRGYMDNNQASLIDYGQRHRAGRPISSSRAESTVNQLVNARMNKRRQMRWSPVGAHRMLQVRAAVLDGRLHELAAQAAA